MTRIEAHLVLACFSTYFVLSAGFRMKEMLVVNGNASQPKVLEETISFNTKDTNSSRGVAVIEFQFTNRKPPVDVTVTKPKAGKRHRHLLRRHCCAAGKLAAKHGLSCMIPRNFKTVFFNLITPARQKYQATVSSSTRRRFRSKAIFHVYRRIKVCVRRSKKGVVQKCCLGYKSRHGSRLRRSRR